MLSFPISFECNGKQYTGEFSQVSGSGGTTTFYLMINNFYCGRLRNDAVSWIFDTTPKTKDFETLGEFFGNYIIAWVDSNSI